MSASEDGRGLELGGTWRTLLPGTPRIYRFVPMVPKTLSDRDAVVQFEAAMFPAFSEIHWDASREARRWSSRCKPQLSGLRSAREMATGNRIMLPASASSG